MKTTISGLFFLLSILISNSNFAKEIPTNNILANENPERASLVDTGYDACIMHNGVNCEANKNLLFRGDQPLPDFPPYEFNFDYFRQHIFSYITHFKQIYETTASLPSSVEELKNYRIVIINLLYDFNSEGSSSELEELQYEFKFSGNVETLQIPEQHKIYGLETKFNSNQYAFQWWPVTLSGVKEDESEYISMNLNWPDKKGTPPHSFEPKIYKPLNFSYLISGKNFSDDVEVNAKDIHSLLSTIPSDGHPLLIYYHCVAGKDRTGAVSMSYFMKFGGYPYLINSNNNLRQYRSNPLSFNQAIVATTIPGRPAKEEAEILGKAYCLTLNKVPGDC